MNGDAKLELKPISKEAVARSIERAEHYRLLNDAEQAESICLDVLAVEPDNQQNLIVLILAMTDQFSSSTGRASPARTLEFVNRLRGDYEKVYYRGIVAEREGRACLTRLNGRAFAYEALHDAMDRYTEAERIRPPGNDDSRLRYNSCVRIIQREQLTPPPAPGRELPLE